MQEELKKEKERTGNVSKKTISDANKRCDKEKRKEVDKHKEMFLAALRRSEMAEKKLKETRAELAKFKDMNRVATKEIKALNNRVGQNKESEVNILQAINNQVSEEKEVLQAEITAQEQQNKKLCDEKEVLQAELAALQEKVNLAEVLSAEVSLSRHLEKETISLEIVSKQGELVSMGEMLSDSNKSLLAEVKLGFQSAIDQITAPILYRMKNFDDKVGELVSDKKTLEGGIGKGFQLEELEKLRNNRIELSKAVEELTAALKDTKKQKAALERELKETQEKAAVVEEKQKAGCSAKVETLKAEKASLRKDVANLEGEKSKVRKILRNGKEKRARLETAQLSLMLERKKAVVEQLVAQSSEEHSEMEPASSPIISREVQMAANASSDSER